MAPAGSGDPEVYRITAAQTSHSDDQSARIGRYLLSMMIRTGCFVMVFVVHGWARWVFAVGAVFLPYVAVVFANSGRGRQAPPDTSVTPPPRRQLEARGPLLEGEQPHPEGDRPNG
jgi:hypothetical protein